MHCILVLQLPTPDLRYGHVVAASSNRELVGYFCASILADQEKRAKSARDSAEREYAFIRPPDGSSTASGQLPSISSTVSRATVAQRWQWMPGRATAMSLTLAPSGASLRPLPGEAFAWVEGIKEAMTMTGR